MSNFEICTVVGFVMTTVLIVWLYIDNSLSITSEAFKVSEKLGKPRHLVHGPTKIYKDLENLKNEIDELKEEILELKKLINIGNRQELTLEEGI